MLPSLSPFPGFVWVVGGRRCREGGCLGAGFPFCFGTALGASVVGPSAAHPSVAASCCTVYMRYTLVSSNSVSRVWFAYLDISAHDIIIPMLWGGLLWCRLALQLRDGFGLWVGLGGCRCLGPRHLGRTRRSGGWLGHSLWRYLTIISIGWSSYQTSLLTL